MSKTHPSITADSFTPLYWKSFKGIADLYGIEALAKFALSQVVVIGLGGVGSWAVESLARTGVNNLILIDNDDICISNINRQLPALFSTKGEDKGDVLKERCLDINPSLVVDYRDDFLIPENMRELLQPLTSEQTLLGKKAIFNLEDEGGAFLAQQEGQLFILDAIDDSTTKTALINFCRQQKLKLVVCGGAGGKIDPSKVVIDDLTQTIQDPMLAKIRYSLRKDYGYKERFKDKKFNVPAVYSTEAMKKPSAESCDLKRLSCANGYGSAQVVTCTIANLASSKILQFIMNSKVL